MATWLSQFERFLSHPIFWGVLTLVAIAIGLSGKLSTTASAIFIWSAFALATFGGYRLFTFFGWGVPIRLLSIVALGCVLAIAAILTVRWLNDKAEPIVPMITWADPSPIAYGERLSDKQLDATTNIDAIPSYEPDKGELLGVGIHQLAVTFNPKDITKYHPVSKAVYLVVNAPAGQTQPGGHLSTPKDKFSSALKFRAMWVNVGNLPEHQRMATTWDGKPWDEAQYLDIRLFIDNTVDVPIQNLDLTISFTDKDHKSRFAGIGQLTDVNGIEFHQPSILQGEPDGVRFHFGKGAPVNIPSETLFNEIRIPSISYTMLCPRFEPRNTLRLIIAAVYAGGVRIPPDQIRITGSYEMTPSEGSVRERVDETVAVAK